MKSTIKSVEKEIGNDEREMTEFEIRTGEAINNCVRRIEELEKSISAIKAC